MTDETPTSGTLLMRLRELDDRAAWNEFVERYTPRIYGWCRHHRLQESDAADVTQEVLGKLVKVIRSFEYDPRRGSFRGWLKTVTNNAVRDFFAELSAPGRGTGDSRIGAALVAIQAPEAISELTAALELEAKHALLREAEELVRLRVQPQTWEAYRLLSVEALPAVDVATRLAMPIAEVYVAKSRVVKCLREEIERLGGVDD